jgi:hypothetical protein
VTHQLNVLTAPTPHPTLQLPTSHHIPVVLARWALVTACGCLVDRQLLGSATAGWRKYASSLLLSMVVSTLVVAWLERRMRRHFTVLWSQASRLQGASEQQAARARDKASWAAAPAQGPGSQAAAAPAVAPAPARVSAAGGLWSFSSCSCSNAGSWLWQGSPAASTAQPATGLAAAGTAGQQEEPSPSMHSQRVSPVVGVSVKVR